MRRACDALRISVLLLGIGFRAGGASDCSPEVVFVIASADTIAIDHRNTTKSCCLELTVDLVVQDLTVDFREGDAGPQCRCYCCFEHRYQAAGFPAGHYLVRVWVGDRLAGEAEVDVEGPGQAGALGEVVQGDCLPISDEPLPSLQSWGRVRLGFRQ